MISNILVSYDQIYDEHAFYFSIGSLSNLFSQYELEIVDIKPQTVHGGSMRYTVAHKEKKQVLPDVLLQIKKHHVSPPKQIEAHCWILCTCVHSLKSSYLHTCMLHSNM